MATLTVGPGQQFATIAAAVAASSDGDVIAVQAGTYTNDFATISTKVTIQAVGGIAKLVATVAPPNGKAILVTRNDITINGLEFTGAKVPDGNGAGIRFEGGHLTILNSHFHHNENGLLAGAWPQGRITIGNSEFGHNGIGDGKTHNLYVGVIADLTIENSYFHDAVVGHEIKSRAYVTTIRDSRIQNEDGNASYEVDLPNGGRAVLTGNVIEQGARSQNPAIVHFGGEGAPHADSSLEISGNTVINRLASPSQRLLLNQTTVTATVADNDVFGLTAAQIAIGPATVTGTGFLAAAPALDTSSPWQSPALGTAGPDDLVLAAPVQGALLDLGAGADRLTLSSAGPNALTVLNAETVVGGAFDDAVTLGAVAFGARVDLGGGVDRLVLSSAGPNRLTVLNTETILGGASDDNVTLGPAGIGTAVDLGGGADRLVLSGSAPNTLAVARTEVIIGGSHADTVTLAAPMAGGRVDLGGGADRLLLGTTGPNTLTVLRIESIVGGGYADNLLLGAAAAGATIELGGGDDRVRLFADAANTLTVIGVETVFGGRHGDRVSVGGTSAAAVDGAGGSDTLLGGGGADRLIGGAGADLMTGAAGADRFIFRAATDSAVAAPDQITDFAAGVDKLVFQGMLQGSFAYRGTGSFTATGNSEARFDAASSTVLVDANGDGAAEMAIRLAGGTLAGLAARDFVWA